ncbi:ExeA family protein [Pelovirga terrestris]|uniref:ATP-binding protein n=1 Tax=Pelovirga terrestris TaxID=2771352 RepID=A0A8J6QWX9_9BACT|nr:ATP-binding protein [Pelovirga terrestris]MBD1399627.1 ATP-binding protein [Pelovirga terrestris]
MNDATLRAVYGLKYNPFLPTLPPQALWSLPGAEAFALRLETLTIHGGFALITGEPGQGKSKTLHWLSEKLRQVPDLSIGVMERPQSSMADFYRELGDIFGVPLSLANRYGGFKSLRARWQAHCDSTLHRAVLLIDEAQEVSSQCLTELRLLQSSRFDSESLLFTVLCGDSRLGDRFRLPELLPLGSRIRARLPLGPLAPETLKEYLDFALTQAGHPQLMTPELMETLAAHAAGNLRVLTHMAAELLTTAASRNLPRLDERLYLELFTPTPKARRTEKR